MFILNKIKELMLKADTPKKKILQTLTALYIFNSELNSIYMSNVYSCIWIIPHLNNIFFLLFKKSYKAGVLTKNQNLDQMQVHRLQAT